jgi:methylenetetrahydrofolate dehydrogenase (NADP+)/methenyltetrahydrofolate cyclohydrolase
MEILLDGKKLAGEMDVDFTARAKALRDKGCPAKLVAILVGDDPASATYVGMKGKRCLKLGIDSETIKLPAETTQDELVAIINRLNSDPSVSGILTQLPLPRHISEKVILETISPGKDVDCFHPVNVGHLTIGNPVFMPATPYGIIKLLEHYGCEFAGKNAVVIGRSNIVGKPVALLLLQKNCTVTICHSKTADLPGVVRQADIVIAAVGKLHMVKRDWIKPGAWVVDVGTNKAEDGSLTGDVDYEEVKDIAKAISPVPGGVGPMTITMLVHNTLTSAEMTAKTL